MASGFVQLEGSACGMALRLAGVAMVRGITQLTRTPRSRFSRASTRGRDCTAALRRAATGGEGPPRPPPEQGRHDRSTEGARRARHHDAPRSGHFAPLSSAQERPGSAVWLDGSPFGPQPGSGRPKESIVPWKPARWSMMLCQPEESSRVAACNERPPVLQPTTSLLSLGQVFSITPRKPTFELIPTDPRLASAQLQDPFDWPDSS